MTTTQMVPQNDRKPKAAQSVPKARLPLLMTIKHTAYELDVSQRSVYNLVANGTLELVHLGDRMSRITSRSVRRAAARRKK